MGNIKHTLTEEDLNNALRNKMSDPSLSYEDIYRGINEIKPNLWKFLYKHLPIQSVLLLGSIGGLFFIHKDTGWFKLVLALYVVFGIIFIDGLRRNHHNISVAIVMLLLFLLLAMTETINSDEIIRLCGKIFDSV